MFLRTFARVEGDIVAEPGHLGGRPGVGDLAGDLHLVVLPLLDPGPGPVTEDFDPLGRHCASAKDSV